MADVLKIYFQIGWTGPSNETPLYNNSSYVSFDDNEVISFSIRNDSNCVIAESGCAFPSVFDESHMDNYDLYGNKYTLELNVEYSTTRAKIEQITTFNNFIKIFYDYSDNGTGSVSEPGADEFTINYFNKSTEVLVDTNYNETRKNFGENAARVKVTVNFYDAFAYGIASHAKRFDGKKIYYNVIVDPDGENINISGINGLISISPLSSGIDIEPQRSGILEVNDIYLSFNNYKHYFENARNYSVWEKTGRKPFRIAYWRPKSSKALAGNNWATIDCIYYSSLYTDYYGEVIPKVNDIVTFYDNTDGTTESFLITTVDTEIISGNYYYKITLNGTLSKTYDDINNDLIYINSWIGKKVSIKMVEIQDEPDGADVSTTTEIFKGIIREPFTVNGANATLKVDNILNETLNKPLLIKSTDTTPLYITSNNSLVSSVVWTTKTGTGVLADTVTIYENATPGKWVITFSSATNYSIIGPNYVGTGSTASDFYDGTGSTDSQIKIATTDWSGTPSSDDVVEFFVSINYNAQYIPTVVHDLIVTHGDTTDENLTTTNEGFKAYISFNYQCTIGQALMALLQGTTFFLTTDYQNRIILRRLSQWDRMTTSSAYGDIVVGDSYFFTNYFKLGYTDIYNKFTIKYGYNYFTGEYEKIKIYPDEFSARNQSLEITGKSRVIEIEYPSMQNGTIDTGYSMYCLYGFGLRTVSVESLIITNKSINPGDIIRVNLNNTRRELTVINKTIDFSGMTIRYDCINNNRTFSTTRIDV